MSLGFLGLIYATLTVFSTHSLELLVFERRHTLVIPASNKFVLREKEKHSHKTETAAGASVYENVFVRIEEILDSSFSLVIVFP